MVAWALVCASICRAETVELEVVPQPLPGTLEEVSALQIDKAHQAVMAEVGEGGNPHGLAAAYLELGQIYAAYELWESAAACARNASILQPEDFKTHYLRGYFEQRAQHPAAAREAFERAAALDPASSLAFLRLAELCLEQEEDAAALAAYEQVLRLDPASASAHFGLGRLAARAGRDAAALDHFRAALSLDPAASRIHLLLAQVLRRLGKTAEAQRELTLRGEQGARLEDPLVDGLAAKANGAAFHKSLGDQMVLAKRFPEAVDAYRLAVATDPSSFAYRKSLGLTLYHQGGVGEAVQQLEAALRVAPETPDAEKAQVVYTLGGIAANGADFEKAAQRFAEAARLDPGFALPYLQLGNLRTRAREYAAAIEDYDRALAIDPTLAEAMFNRATALMDLGRFAEALPALERLLVLAPQYPRAEELLKVARERLATGS